MKPLGEFDQDYSDAMLSACLTAIVGAAHDKDTNTAVLRNAEIYQALMTIMAGLLASSSTTSTPRGIRLVSEDFAKRLGKRVTAARDEYQRDGTPFQAAEFTSYQ